MYFDLEDYRPDTPRVAAVISVREGVLLSLIAHMAAVVAILLAPAEWAQPSREVVPVQPSEPLRFVEMAPLIDREELARRLAEQSDLDRRSGTRERAPLPENTAPLSRGDTLSKVESAPEVIAAGPEVPAPDAAAVAAASPPPDPIGMLPPPDAAPPAPASGRLGRSLRNLQQYLQGQNFDNPRGGDAEPSADFQFDSKGVDFGPWLRRFASQIRRNWLIPQVAELSRGRVVVQFSVLRNGTIVELRVPQPSGIEALTVSAVNALKLSNPTSTLPPEYPDDRILFTVTFHYNEGPLGRP